MPAIERMTITIPNETGRDGALGGRGGEYTSTSEVIRDALRAWARVHDEERRELAALRDAIRVGLDSGPPIAAEEVFAQLRGRYAAKA